MTIKEITNEISQMLGLRQMVETYEEIAATRMRTIRNGVLQNRFFLSEINLIFQQVKSSYKKELLMFVKKKDSGGKNMILHNGKSVYVLLSSNSGLYGDVIPKTYNLFSDEIQKLAKDPLTKDFDAVIIGKYGAILAEANRLGHDYKYFDFPDSNAREDLLKQIISFIIPYEKVFVFYAQFKSLVSQEPNETNISGNLLESDESVQSKVKYIFEPSLDKILQFFEQEIFASIFEQTVREFQLSKFASRMVTLDSAVQNIGSNLKILALSQSRLKHRAANRKQLETVSTMNLWKK